MMDKSKMEIEGHDPLEGWSHTLDRLAMSGVGKATNALSPITLTLAYQDWLLHMATSPGKQMHVLAKAGRKAMRLADYALRQANGDKVQPAIRPLPQDHRFDDPAWKEPPFDVMAQAFLLGQQWLHAATTCVPGVSTHHEDVVSFIARQALDMMAPTNFLATNPVLQKRVVETQGRCLVDGLRFLSEDIERSLRGERPAGVEDFPVGEVLATTPGKVVYRNDLIELIQYDPTTEQVRPEPVLIVPAWIMKYYILDLSAHNSLVRWLTEQGFTVFMISWHNPTEKDRDRDFEDYLRLGPLAALDVVTAITGAEAIHATGYCLGGTLLSVAAAELAHAGQQRLKTITLLAAQTDFSEPGELGLFIDESQLNLLEGTMWSEGYLDSTRMGGAFQMLRSNDLIWSRNLKTYLMGEREPFNDLMAWNADGTRMPYAMHTEYLRRMYLDNELARGHFRMDGHTITLSALRQPIFAVGTEHDHVAPWRSVHKIHMLTETEVTFVLTTGGHNAGIVSEPGHAHRSYRQFTRADGYPAIAPDDWLLHAEQHEGSWWEAWGAWLADHSGEPVPPPTGAPERGYPTLCNAPGSYVFER